MAKRIDWYYHRNGCISCSRSQGFLTEHGLTITEQTSANRPLGEDRARALVKDARRLVVMKGRKVAVFDLTKDKPKDAELLELMLGTTGNLRAPVVVRGGTVLVGFNADVYADELG